MDFFYLVLALIFTAYVVFIFVLQLKVWDMCNDIKTLKEFLINHYNKETLNE